jgi:hypothetical protein
MYKAMGPKRLVLIGANTEPLHGFCLRDAPDQAFFCKVITMWQTLPHSSLGDLGKIKAPTLIVAGEFDVIKRSHTDQLAMAIFGSEEKIIEGGTIG